MTQSVLESCNDDGVVAVKCGKSWLDRSNYAVERHFRKAKPCVKAGDKAVFHTTYSQLLLKRVLAVSCFGMELWLVNIICI
jgi:hypothetical protein